jgi:hypothetical protein
VISNNKKNIQEERLWYKISTQTLFINFLKNVEYEDQGSNAGYRSYPPVCKR